MVRHNCNYIFLKKAFEGQKHNNDLLWCLKTVKRLALSSRLRKFLQRKLSNHGTHVCIICRDVSLSSSGEKLSPPVGKLDGWLFVRRNSYGNENTNAVECGQVWCLRKFHEYLSITVLSHKLMCKASARELKISCIQMPLTRVWLNYLSEQVKNTLIRILFTPT